MEGGRGALLAFTDPSNNSCKPRAGRLRAMRCFNVGCRLNARLHVAIRAALSTLTRASTSRAGRCIGLATLAVGGAFGVLAIVANNDAKKCPTPCTIGSPEATDSNAATDRAITFANISNVRESS